MSEKLSKEEIIGGGEILFHPLREQIWEMLEERPDGLYINQLADLLEKERRLVAFHLGVMEKHDLVTSEYVICEMPHSKGRATRVFKITSKTHEIKKELCKLLS